MHLLVSEQYIDSIMHGATIKEEKMLYVSRMFVNVSSLIPQLLLYIFFRMQLSVFFPNSESIMLYA